MNAFLSLPVLAVILFCIGLMIVVLRKNLIVMLIGVELMLNSANLNLISFSSYKSDATGQLLILFVLIIAVCEAAVGLAIIFRVYRYYGSSEPDQIADIHESK